MALGPNYVFVVVVIPLGAGKRALGPGQATYGAAGPCLIQVMAIEDP